MYGPEELNSKIAKSFKNQEQVEAEAKAFEDFSKISQQFKKLEPSQIDPYINKLKETFDLERSTDTNMIKLKNLISDIKNKRQKQLEQHYKKAVKQLQNTINYQGCLCCLCCLFFSFCCINLFIF